MSPRLVQLKMLREKVDAEIRALEKPSRLVVVPAPIKPRPAKVAQCGTDGGYYRHLRRTHTPPCPECKAAHAAAEKARYRPRREAS